MGSIPIPGTNPTPTADFETYLHEVKRLAPSLRTRMEIKYGKCSEKLGAFMTYIHGTTKLCTKCLMSYSFMVWVDIGGNK